MAPPPIPTVFSQHHYVHSKQCIPQLARLAHYAPIGLTYGEGVEQAWAASTPHVPTNQMAAGSRHDTLDDSLADWVYPELSHKRAREGDEVSGTSPLKKSCRT
ncbi:hypothetical protein B0H17DRAFT_1143209 [Mycena rosella]|uniref:Uncharacterized protein n=1 Tax=Mycena rosella TaxID=1033263 RepID=A0AAD7G6Z2_MYCRO|nr:hypothetical protein B0H17DRAFT_1143209 [Mycena rosella]